MNDSVFFATFDPLFINAPEACELCIGQPPVFTYEYSNGEESGERQYLKGFCCPACAVRLLKKLENREAQDWAEEEREMEADHLDVTDFQKRRLVTFGDRLHQA
jgi:hypothetical protein